MGKHQINLKSEAGSPKSEGTQQEPNHKKQIKFKFKIRRQNPKSEAGISKSDEGCQQSAFSHEHNRSIHPIISNYPTDRSGLKADSLGGNELSVHR